VDTLAKMYGVDRRQIHRWRKDFGLTGRGVLAAAPRDLAALIRSTEAAGQVIREEALDAISRHQAGGGAQDPAEDLPEKLRDPLKNPEIKAAMEDFAKKARLVSTQTTLIDLQRAALKLYCLVVALSPLHTWDGGAETFKGIVKTLDWTRKLEAGLPSPPRDEQALRVQAANQLMRELQEVLGPDDRRVLATIVQRGADRIRAKRNVGGQHQQPRDPAPNHEQPGCTGGVNGCGNA